MKIKEFILKRSWLIGVLIFIVALGLRIIAALKIAWRPDEIVYVDWIGSWFAKYFWQYFFQFKHHFYPPASPVFGNPPLAMWLMTIGIYLAKTFHFSELLGARLINCFLGALSALWLFNLGKKWFNLRSGILAGLAFAFLPLIITNNATAYLETLLILLVIIQIELIFNYWKFKKNKYLYLLGMVLGLSLLVKLTVFILVISLVILIPIVFFKNQGFKNFWLSYLVFLF
jgi:4-amino-4-deoxy-L-arabinose transferase-like glycosyltransferase